MTRSGQEQDTHALLARPGVRRIVLIAGVVAVSLIFILENTAETTIRLLIPQVTMPCGALLIA